MLWYPILTTGAQAAMVRSLPRHLPRGALPRGPLPGRAARPRHDRLGLFVVNPPFALGERGCIG